MLRLNGFAAAVAITVSACAVSTQQELEMGAQYAAEINRKIPLVRDGTANSIINQIGDQIARTGQRGFNYTFYIVNSDVVNAFAVPGGHVYINRGLIERTRSYAELAGVLAHEIGHVEHRHGAEQMERMQRASLGVNLAYILTGRQPGPADETVINAAGTAYFARHSRAAENEADESAVPMLIAARINPNGMVNMFELLLSLQSRQPSVIEGWFSTHPTTRDRINHTRSVIARYNASQLRGLTSSSSSYNTLKSRLRSLPAAPRS